jgi:transcriptional regulator with XRE-family HTH domain
VPESWHDAPIKVAARKMHSSDFSEVSMAAEQSPTVRRRRLGHELRELREQARFTLDEAAARLEDFSAAKISRIETAKVGVRPRDVEDLLTLYGVQDAQHRKNLLTLTREARQRGWWEQFGDAISPSQELFIGLESEAVLIRVFSTEVISGLFQTEAYAREVLKAIWFAEPPEHIERRVQARMARQKILKRQDRPDIRCIFEENVLRRPVGGHEIHRAQLQRLADAADYSNVSIRVLPLSIGAHPGNDGTFEIVNLPPPDPSVVFVEYRAGGIYMEQEEVNLYSDIFMRLEDAAMDSQQSLAFIRTLSGEEAR